MRNFTRVLAAALFCGALFSAAFVGAQDATGTPAGDATMEMPTAEATMADATMMPATDATAMPSTEATADASMSQTGSTGSIVCDSDLILNLYVAEHYFGFDGVMSAAMSSSTDTSTMVDVTTLDKGQYAALFAAPMMMTPSTMMTQDQMTAAAGMMTMDDASMMSQMATMMPPGTDMSGMTTLSSAAIDGEDVACTNLRTSLNRFYTILAYQGMQADMNMMGSTGMEATAEATMAADAGSTTANVSFSTTLSGANEVPPADPDGTGTAAVTVDMANSQVCYTLTVQNIALPAAAAHIHRGAAGENGDVVVPFDLAPDASGNATSCVKADSALLQEIATNPAGFYVNVHSSEFPNGAVRGQVSG